MAQNQLGKLTSLVCLGLCLLTSGICAQTTADHDAEQRELELHWQEKFWTHLETSAYSQFRVRAAIRLIRTGDSRAVGYGEQLINKALDEPSPDPTSLWLLASDCQWRKTADLCAPGGVYETLAQTDPDNAAVTLLRFSQARFEGDESLLDTEINRQLLFKAAEADYFDLYWGRDADKLYGEALKFIEINPIPLTTKSEELALQFEMTPTKYAFHGIMSLILTAPTTGYSNMVDLCRLQIRNRHPDGIRACKNLARILREKSDTMLTRSVGYGIERAMLKAIDPNDPGIKHWQNRGDIFSVMQMCFLPYWQVNMKLSSEKTDSSMMNWIINLSDHGEWEGTRLTAFQDYITSPEHFVVNPADCDRLKDLDEEAMAGFINNQGPAAAWRAMQDEVRSSQTQATTTTKEYRQ